MTTCKLEDIPKVIKEVEDLQAVFTTSVKGDYSNWGDVVQRCESFFADYREKNKCFEVENEGQKHFIPALEEEVCIQQRLSCHLVYVFGLVKIVVLAHFPCYFPYN